MITPLDEALIPRGAPVLVRADLDIDVKRVGKGEDNIRLRAHDATLMFLLGRGAHIRIIAHRGRPGGVPDSAYTLHPFARVLSGVLKRPVVFISDPFSSAAYKRYRESKDILLFQNMRFWPGEEKNDPAFGRGLAAWGDYYVNEAFSDCHRAHASMTLVPRILPAYAGMHLREEIAALDHVMDKPARPLVAILGGAKMETKLPLIRRFIGRADSVVVGGALANTLFASMGRPVGKSLREERPRTDFPFLASKKLYLPRDVLVARALRMGALTRVVLADDVKAWDCIGDIGPCARDEFVQLIRDAKTVVWNGPVGFAEIPEFACGTIAIADAMRTSPACTIAGGGDTLEALSRYGREKGFDHISTGGGAMLAFLSGEQLPGLEALKHKSKSM